jgi:hypothetical protein
VRLVRERANSLMAQGKTVEFFCVGRKGYDQIRRVYPKQIIEFVDLRAVRTLGYDNAHDIADKVIGLFNKGSFDVATLFYSHFKNVVTQTPTAQQVIPAVFEQKAAGQAVPYDYEPEESEILADLLPRNIAVQVFRALLENQASFYGAQMSAMDNATRNAGDMIKKQTLVYNRTRQAMITKEDEHGEPHRTHHPGHRRRRRRAVRRAPAGNPERAGDHQPGQPPGAGSGSASRREHRAHHRHGLLRGSGARPARDRHGRPHHGAGG